MASKIQHLTTALQNTRLLHNPTQTVQTLLQEILNIIGKQLVMGIYGLHPCDQAKNSPFPEVIRIRPNLSVSEVFSKREELSYKPQCYNNSYQRASTPEQTMFYGSLIDGNTSDIPVRLTPTLEGVPWLRDKISQGMQKVTYSRWVVRKDLHLIPVIFNPEYAGNSRVSKYLEQAISSIYKNNPEFAEDILEFHQFIASEFSIPHTDSDDHNYLVTAIFTQMFIEKGKGRYDGVLYPSCRVDGNGTNIAILPDASERLDLMVVGECMIYKKGPECIIKNLTISDSDGKTPLTNFQFKKMEDELDEQQILFDLGVHSLDYRSK
jgi:hypothetical protein